MQEDLGKTPAATAGKGRLVDDPAFIAEINRHIAASGADPESHSGSLIRDIVMTGFKLASDGRDTGELKLLTSSLKELRYAYNVFAEHAEPHKVTIFGSARTKPEAPDYKTTVTFSRLMGDAGWLSITGAGDGIMRTGREGPGRESSFGLAIRLPFETTANEFIKGDSKLINFRYFFTRKLMFVSQCEAVVALPGGFGTQDELFESLTLVQTGKSSIVPIVLIEHPGGVYWKHWDNYVRRSLLDSEMISAEDLNLYHITRDPQEAVDHILRFYRNYHSSRYVRDDLVIRIRKPLPPGDIERLNTEFHALVKEGQIVQRGAYEVEEEHLDLPRIAFTHTRRAFGHVRRLIDRINEFDPVDETGLDPSEIY